MLGTGLALLGWVVYAVAREHRIARMRQASRNKLASRDGTMGVAQRTLGRVQVAPVCAHRLLQGSACPLANNAWKRAYIMVDAVRTYQPSSRLVYDLRGGTA